MASDDLPGDLSPPGALVLAGPFGSGKTEIAINLALRWAQTLPTYLADLDVVTPYFRPRDIAGLLAAAGVTVLAPGGAHGALDGPVFPREMGFAALDETHGLILDVGGQPHGAGVLLHWREALLARGARMCVVVNPHRPDARRAEWVVGLVRAIADRAGLPPAGIIANGNLGVHTTAAEALEGAERARELGGRLGVPVLAMCCPLELVEACAAEAPGIPIVGLSFHLRPPWDRVAQ